MHSRAELKLMAPADGASMWRAMVELAFWARCASYVSPRGRRPFTSFYHTQAQVRVHKGYLTKEPPIKEAIDLHDCAVMSIFESAFVLAFSFSSAAMVRPV